MELTRVSRSIFVLLVALLVEISSLPSPNKRPVIIDSPEINTIGKGEVGASWGGHSASAGLGGGLHAEANAPGAGAAAGLGGVSYAGGGASAGAGANAGAGASAGVGGAGANAGAGAHGPGFFDNVFNIPISVLQAVNSYLNQKGQPGTQHPHPSGPHNYKKSVAASGGSAEAALPASIPVERFSDAEAGAHAEAEAGAGTGVGAGAGVGSSAGAGAHAGVGGFAGASASAGAGSAAAGGNGYAVGRVPHRNKDYDNIFNIPISALKSVNQLLNG